MLNKLLLPLSWLYEAGFWIWKKTVKEETLGKIVISVGNLTWGGTGKTPFSVKISQTLLGRGFRPCVLSRGYKRKSSEPAVISKHASLGTSYINEVVINNSRRKLRDEDVLITGDEPKLILESVESAVVGIGRDRVLSAELASVENFDYFILDDGFQHRRIKRNYDIVLVNALNPFGNGFLIPCGILRERPSALKRADLVIINHYDKVSAVKLEDLSRSIRKYYDGAVLHSKYVLKAVRNFVSGTPLADSMKNIVAMSGLGDNRQFHDLLAASGYKIIQTRSFEDHYWYAGSEINSIIERAPAHSSVVTTLKDYVRIKGSLNSMEASRLGRLYYAQIDIEFKEGESLWLEELRKALRYS